MQVVAGSLLFEIRPALPYHTLMHLQQPLYLVDRKRDQCHKASLSFSRRTIWLARLHTVWIAVIVHRLSCSKARGETIMSNWPILWCNRSSSVASPLRASSYSIGQAVQQAKRLFLKSRRTILLMLQRNKTKRAKSTRATNPISL